MHVTNRISEYTFSIGSTSSTYTYEYDAQNYFQTITTPSGEIRYKYDDVGQLIREDNTPLNKTCVYSYDNAGNLISKKTYGLTAWASTPSNLIDEEIYTYGNANWGDQLTAAKRTVLFTIPAVCAPKRL